MLTYFYSDIGRTINEAITTGAQMTAETCIAFCDAKGYAYAGTEYVTECCK